MKLHYFTNNSVRQIANDKYNGDLMKGWVEHVTNEFDPTPEQMKAVFEAFDKYINKHSLAEESLSFALNEVFLQLPKINIVKPTKHND